MWEFFSKRSTPHPPSPSPCLGTPCTPKKIMVYFALLVFTKSFTILGNKLKKRFGKSGAPHPPVWEKFPPFNVFLIRTASLITRWKCNSPFPSLASIFTLIHVHPFSLSFMHTFAHAFAHVNHVYPSTSKYKFMCCHPCYPILSNYFHF